MSDMTLKTSYERPATYEEVSNLVFGTGATAYPWWVSIDAEKNGEEVNYWDGLDGATTLVFTAWNPDEAEGVTKTYRLTPAEIIAAAGKCLDEQRIGNYSASERNDIMTDSIGYCDAIEADVVLQIAVYKDVIYS